MVAPVDGYGDGAGSVQPGEDEADLLGVIAVRETVTDRLHARLEERPVEVALGGRAWHPGALCCQPTVPDEDHLAAIGLVPGGDELVHVGETRRTPRCAEHRRDGVQPAASIAGPLVASVRGEVDHAPAEAVKERSGIGGDGIAEPGDEPRVVLGRLRPVARGSTPAELLQRARRVVLGGPETCRAAAHRHHVVDRLEELLGDAPGGDRPQVGPAVVADGGHDGQPGEAFARQLDHDLLLGVLAPTVVPGAVAVDLAHLADRGLELRRCRCPGHACRVTHHVRDRRRGSRPK